MTALASSLAGALPFRSRTSMTTGTAFAALDARRRAFAGRCAGSMTASCRSPCGYRLRVDWPDADCAADGDGEGPASARWGTANVVVAAAAATRVMTAVLFLAAKDLPLPWACPCDMRGPRREGCPAPGDHFS